MTTRTAWGCALLAAVYAIWASAGPARGSVAQYEVTFNATWSQATHPTDWPVGAHFSPLIGGTHNANDSFWRAGGMASPGIEAMAELGATSPLRSEVSARITAGDAYSAISGGGIFPSP